MGLVNSTQKPVKQWADGPYKLIQTPRAVRGNVNIAAEHGSFTAANEMAIIHNVMIRGLNCIVLQATNIPKENTTDVQDFLTMCYAWSKTIHIHHDNEEALFFGWIEDDLGVKHGEIMGDNVKQHHAFREGLKDFDDYVKNVREGKEKYDGKKLTALVRGFVDGDEGIYRHLNEEIPTFVALERFGDKINWKRWFEGVQREAIGNAEYEYEVPWVVSNLHSDNEDGIHRPHFPPWPWFITLWWAWRYFPKHAGAWRFCCCDSYGRPKELPYV